MTETMDYDEIVALYQNLPSITPEEQFELAMMLLEELRLEDTDLDRIRERVGL